MVIRKKGTLQASAISYRPTLDLADVNSRLSSDGLPAYPANPERSTIHPARYYHAYAIIFIRASTKGM